MHELDREMRRSGEIAEREQHLRKRGSDPRFETSRTEILEELARLLGERNAPTQERVELSLARLDLDPSLHDLRLQVAQKKIELDAEFVESKIASESPAQLCSSLEFESHIA